MDGIPPRTYNGAPLHITPGLCLFYMNSENKLKPIAIQVFLLESFRLLGDDGTSTQIYAALRKVETV